VIELGIPSKADIPIVMTGGVVQYNPYIVELLTEQLDTKILVPPKPQLMGALGAAIIAKDLYQKLEVVKDNEMNGIINKENIDKNSE
jgi:activator of 2-hydroxyglutaryl-CoA dehydratase